MSKNIDVKKLSKKINGAVEKALKKAAEEEIAPIIKEAYSKSAKKNLEKITVKSKAAQKNIDNEAIAEETYNISEKMSKIKNIKSTPYQNGMINVYNDSMPDNPLWNQKQVFYNTTFTQWLVNGDLMIHPALTSFKGQYIPHDKNEIDNSSQKNKSSAKDITWDKYTKVYKFAPEKFVDKAIDDIKKNHIDEIKDVVATTIAKEIAKELNK